MSSRVVTVILLVALAFTGLILGSGTGALNLPGNQQGYEPAQPIEFSHRLHAGEMQVSCNYCHSGAETSRHAGVPAASTCLNCHRFVAASVGALRAEEEAAGKEKRAPRRLVSPEIQKIYDALALDDKMLPAHGREPQPLAWNRIYKLPDFVYFEHRAHVGAGVSCQTCHGPVETMERVRQVPDLSMGWCVNCHRDANQRGVAGRKVNASIDCSACHF